MLETLVFKIYPDIFNTIHVNKMKVSDKFHLEDINKLKTVLTGKTEDIKWRIQHINIVSKLLDENKKKIKSLLICKSEIEGLSEILLVKEEISLIKKKLTTWMRPKY